ncbi:hypothetical protein R5R35_007115 [Gryllus longicercus]|uniref:EGF-like domain-containing protein n=2 Tax=Gryllus longicercus TaxID=2509291 RepID=A0AAN9VZP4_9ORTH
MQVNVHLPIFVLTIVLAEQCLASDNTKTELPPCLGCKTVVNSFKKGMKKMTEGTESANGLASVQEYLCTDVDWGKEHCQALATEMTAALEDWWLHKQNTHPDLYHWLCISTRQVCCPDEHFGSNCNPCPGYPSRICNGNGKCRGAGTRKGNGSCICDAGYDGDLCDKCGKYFYESYRDEDKLLCSPCHESCQGTCSQAGPKGCVACKSGWQMDTEKGCLDIDECYTGKNPCKRNEFCVNNDGSYVCLKCDRSCGGCTGDGPDMCTKCARGYTLKDGMCVDEQQMGRDWHVNLTRYLTYAGLCVATCIVFQKNMVLAGLIGLSVGIYISVAEYYLGSPSSTNEVDVAKMLGLQAGR